MRLLEAIYNKLLTDKDRPATCPSRYINSSLVIAQRMLHEALFGLQFRDPFFQQKLGARHFQ